MNKNSRNSGLLTTIVVLLVLILICLFLLMGTIVLAAQMAPVQQAAPQSSMQEEEPDIPAAALPQQPQQEEPQPEEPAQPSSSERVIPQPESKPEAQPQSQPQAQPAAPQSSSSSTAAAPKAESSKTSEYPPKTYKESGYYDSKKTYGDVSIREGDILLANKTIMGDLTISRFAEDGVTLENCIVGGTLYIKGGQSVVLHDSRVGKIVVKDHNQQETTIFAEGLTRTGTITAYTDLILDESGLNPKRSGFSELTTDGSDTCVSLALNETVLTKVTLKKEADLYVDFTSVVEQLRVSKPSMIDGDGNIKQLTIASNDIISYIIPDKEEKTSQRYDEVDYRTH